MQSSIDIHFEHLIPVLSPWHTELETTKKGIPPHITLLWPWKTPPIKKEEIEILKNAINDIKQFDIKFHKVQYFPNGTIFLACKHIHNIEKIMKIIFQTFPECKPYGGEFENPIPHVTIAKVPDKKLFSDTYKKIKTKLNPLLPITFLVNEIVIMEELASGKWKTKTILNLRK